SSAGLTMELSCESVRYLEDRRPASCKFVELHVLYVPDDQWDVKLNKVPAEAIESFISAGFIRVYPDVSLKTLRSELGALLGAERSIDRFSFLKCVGRSLALAPQPELYLLPAVESDSSVCSASLSPDTSSSSPDHQTYYHPPKTCSLPAGTKEPVKFPLIPQCSHQPPPTPSLEEEEEDDDDDEQSYSSSEADGENEEEEGLSSDKIKWAEQGCCPKRPQNERSTQPISQSKAMLRCEADAAQVKKESPERGEEETCRKKRQPRGQSRAARDSGVAPSLEDRDSGFSLTDGKSKDAPKSMRNKATSGVMCDRESSGVVPACPVHLSPSGSRLGQGLSKTICLLSHKQRGTDRGNQAGEGGEEAAGVDEARAAKKGERFVGAKQTPQEPSINFSKVTTFCVCHSLPLRRKARDSWKKKYFETKKATAPLEENLRNLRQELETFYNKLLHQLQARDNRGKPRRQGRSSVKNELIIQIMTESHEIDNLKRKVEDAKMKLVTEIKLRKQAATELRALKAELAQKKSQSSHRGPTTSLGFGNTTRDRPQVQGTTI
ncbi:hypothetical protein L3Q82_025712, partial [Scortum barcoo]